MISRNFLRRLCRGVALATLLCIVACKHDNDDSNSSLLPTAKQYEEKKGLLAVFYAPSSRGDRAFVDLLTLGASKAANSNSLLIAQYEPTAWDKVSESFDTALLIASKMHEKNKKSLFIFTDTGYSSFITQNSEKIAEYAAKGVTFLFGESKQAPAQNVHTYYMPVYGIRYEAGLLANRLVEYNNDASRDKLLIILANNKDESQKDSANAFIDGFYSSGTYGTKENAAWLSPYNDDTLFEIGELDTNKNLYVLPLSDAAGGGFDQQQLLYDLGKNETFIAACVLIIFPLCGGSIHGILRYNREFTDSFWTIGMDTDRQAYSIDVPYSVIKHIDRVIEKCVSQWLKESLPQHQSFGISEGYTEILISEYWEDKFEVSTLNSAHQTAIEKESEHEK